jgi:Flp pilus assembly protein TadG
VVPGVVKASLVIGLLAGFGVDLGRPAVTRFQLQTAAEDAANAAERDLSRVGAQGAAQTARSAAVAESAELVTFDVDGSGRVKVELARHVDPLVLGGVGAVRSWYDVEVSAVSDGPPAP